MKLTFYKYQGTGNDFIIIDNRIIDNRIHTIKLTAEQIKKLCDRRYGIGGDGLMLLNNKAGYDFAMEYYNADGLESSMCGNGGRCLVKFAYHQGMRKSTYTFMAVDGEHEATIDDNGWVNLKMRDVHEIDKFYTDSVLNTGSPHYVRPVTDLRRLDVYKEGKAIRNSNGYKKEGINVNFVEETSDNLFVRTYERGVENETLSCGTGVTAAALVHAHNDVGFNRIDITTLGGKMAVEFDKTGEERFENIWLCGPAEFVFEGTITI